MKLHPILATSLFIPTLGALTSASLAEDFTVEESSFQVETTLNAVFLPTQSQAILVEPKAWMDFPITSFVNQGSQVKKGDTLIGIDTSKLDKHIEQLEKSRASAELALKKQQSELAQLEISTPISLENAARAEKESAENLKWYESIGHTKDIQDSKMAVKFAEQSLSYVKEELKQLLKMYKEDNNIEETEEIILTRTRNSVEKTELMLKGLKIKSELDLNTTIPRKLAGKQLAAKNAQIANGNAQKNLPSSLQEKRLAVALAVRNDAKTKQNLADLKADRALMEITAPADGLVYYGAIKNGRWSAASALKTLRTGGKLPASSTVMTFIPSSSPLQLSAFTDAKSLPALTASAPVKGHAITDLNPYQLIPAQVNKTSAYPMADGSFHITLTPTLAKGHRVVPGMKAVTHLTSSSIAKALKVPHDYLSRTSDGTFTVEVKLADGKTDSRTVTPGASSKDWVVITKGLEKGQVIVK